MWFWLRISREVVIELLLRAAVSSEGSTGAGGAAAKMVSSHGC